MIIFNHTDSDFNYAKNGEYYNIPAQGFADIDEATGVTEEELVACYGTRISIKEKLEDNNGENYNELVQSIQDGKDNETEADNGTTTDNKDNTEDETSEGSNKDEEDIKDIPSVEDIVKDVVNAADKAVKEVKDQVKTAGKKGRPAKATTKKK